MRAAGGVLQAAAKFLFGYDIFISYSWRDAKGYAAALARELADLDYSCYLDQEEPIVGEALRPALKRAIKRTKTLVLVGTPQAIRSQYIQYEVTTFLEKKGAILAINVGGTLGEDARRDDAGEVWIDSLPRLQEAVWIDEETEPREPSPTVVTTIHRKFRYTRRKSLLRGVLGAVSVVFILLGIFSWLQRNEAVRQRGLAERRQQIALARQLAAQAELLRNQEIRLQERGALLAVEAMKRLDALDHPSVEVDRALRHSLTLLPRRVDTLELGQYVKALAFSPDGRFLTAASDYGRVRVRDLESGREQTFDYGFKAEAISLSPDGRTLVTAGGRDRAGTAGIWDVATGEELGRLDYRGSAAGLALSPDRRFLAFKDTRGDGWVRAVASGQELASLSMARSLAFSGDGQYLVGSSGVTQPATGAEIWTLSGAEMPGALERAEWLRTGAGTAVFSPDGGHLAVTDLVGRTIEVWRVAKRRLRDGRRVSYEGNLETLALSQGARYLAVVRNDYRADVLEVATRERVGLTYGSELYAAAFSPAGQYLAVGGFDRKAEVWEIPEANDAVRLASEHPVSALAFGPDAAWVATLGREREDAPEVILQLWDPATGEHRESSPRVESWKGATFSADGRYLAAETTSDALEIVEVESGRPVARFPSAEAAERIALSADGGELAVAGGGRLRVLEVPGGETVAELAYEGVVLALVLGPEGRYLATEETRVSGEGRRGRSEERRTLVRRVESGEVVWSAGWGDSTAAFEMSPDGRHLAVLDGGTLRIRTLEAPGETEEVSGPERLAGFGADGRHLATLNDGRTVHVWRTSPLTELARLVSTRPLQAASISPDGRFVGTLSESGEATVWLLQPHDLVAAACARLSRNLSPDEWRQYLGGEPQRPTCPDLPTSDG